MKKIFILFSFIAVTASSAFAQLSDEEYAYVTMDLQGILNLTMTNDPNVNFSFKSIPDYQQGITKFNATRLDVDATVAWDLFAYATSNSWVQVDQYSTNGQAVLPAEILEIQSVNGNSSSTLENFNAFTSLKGRANSGVSAAGEPTAVTQFLAGMTGQAVGESYAPGSAQANPTTNQFRVHYRLVPGIPATFPNTVATAALPVGEFAQSGYYYLEVVYALVEDL